MPPGRAWLSIRPKPIGSLNVGTMIGMVEVAPRAAMAPGAAAFAAPKGLDEEALAVAETEEGWILGA